jgi:hypothetical protein
MGDLRGATSMRTIIVTIAGILTIGTAAPAFAQVHSYAACEALAEQRGGDVGATNHRLFMRDCLAGKIPMSTRPGPATPQHILEARSLGYCQALAEKRGAETGGTNHRLFIKQCMEGRIPAVTPPAQPAAQHVLDAEKFGYCTALAAQRGAESGGTNHRLFMDQCMMGEIR